MLSSGTYGQVSKLLDSGHFFGEYFVWQQESSGSQPIGDFSFNRDVRSILREPVTNTFLVKLTYWLGL